MTSHPFTILLLIGLGYPFKETGGLGGVPLGIPLPKKYYVTNRFYLLSFKA
jgi:hypothetical protein